MLNSHFLLCAKTLVVAMMCALNASAMNSMYSNHVEMAMRAIGHEVLLQAQDSTSRVLPVQSDGNRYVIAFENDLVFEPSRLSSAVDSILHQSGISNHYLAQMLHSSSQEVEWGMERDFSSGQHFLACGGRMYPRQCYQLCITIMDDLPFMPSSTTNNVAAVEKEEASSSLAILPLSLGSLVILLLLAWGVWTFLKRKESSTETHPDIIRIGQFTFDKRSMELSFKGHSHELTSKEADLLVLLHNSVNSTLKREQILHAVWGDQGDYVGRTLDVFVSKLRKRLEADPNIKIANIRGVGYRMVLVEGE